MQPECLRALVDGVAADDPAWISRATHEQLDGQLRELGERLDAVAGRVDRLPLYGVPFAVKDNIDVAGWVTTAACPEFAYTARQDARVVERLKAAGAILVGKTNLDQFATGLAGNRSPYGPVPNPFDPRYVSGGSSSGSASVVARGLVPFALGTDTAGSGRVPAGFNNIVGFKPTRGRLSTHGVVPACRTLDCVSVFGATIGDAALVTDLAAGIDSRDPYTRPPPLSRVARGAPRTATSLRLAVPKSLEFFGDAAAAAAFRRDREVLSREGAELAEIDFEPFAELARLLYGGPWIAERYLVLRELLEDRRTAVHPAVALLVEGATGFTAADAFAAEYERARLARRIHEALTGFDALMVPTAPRFYTLAEVEADPIETITRLGYYTNFANLGDLCALALPGSFRRDGLPAGLTLLAPAWQDDALLEVGSLWESRLEGRLGATTRPRAEALRLGWADGLPPVSTTDEVHLAVVGAHLRGMPLNHQLTQRGGRLIATTSTAPCYRLFALKDTDPPKPGLVRSASGAAIEVEVWSLATGHFGDFVAEVPPPLGIGNVELADGVWVKGFICEPHALEGSQDITAFGGWRAFLADG